MYSHKQHPQSAAPALLPSERISELLEQLKGEYQNLEVEYNVAKQQRDEYERKLEQQINEFHNMRQTILELESNFQSIRQQYEDKIIHLQNQLKQFQANPAAAQIGSSSPVPPPLLSSQQAPAQSLLQRPPPPPQQQRVNSPNPLKDGASGRRTPPSAATPAKKQRLIMDEAPNNPAFAFSQQQQQQQQQQQSLPPPPQQQNVAAQQQQQQHFPPMVSNYGNDSVRSLTNAPGMNAPAIPSFNDLDQNNLLELGKNDPKKGDMVKKEGMDWVVVYNPQVKTNVNINLFHNLDHHSVVCCVKFSQDGKYLATGSNKVAQIFSVETGQRVRVFPAEDKLKNSNPSPTPNKMPNDSDAVDPLSLSADKEDSYVRSVCFSPDGKYLVAGAEDKTVKIWEIKTGALKHSFYGHELDIYSLDFSSDNRFVVSGSGDGKAKIWSMESGKCEYTLGNDEIGPKEGVTSVAISPDGRTVAAGSLDCVVRLWDVQTGKFLESFKGHDDSVYSVAFSPDGKTLASGSLDKTLKLWDVNRSNGMHYRCIATLSGHRDYVLSVAFSPDGKWLISGSKDRSVQFWDPRSNVLHLMLQGHKNSVISVALNPQQQIFATGSGDFRARVWEYTHI